jgi:hypothetical protein
MPVAILRRSFVTGNASGIKLWEHIVSIVEVGRPSKSVRRATSLLEVVGRAMSRVCQSDGEELSSKEHPLCLQDSKASFQSSAYITCLRRLRVSIPPYQLIDSAFPHDYHRSNVRRQEGPRRIARVPFHVCICDLTLMDTINNHGDVYSARSYCIYSTWLCLNHLLRFVGSIYTSQKFLDDQTTRTEAHRCLWKGGMARRRIESPHSFEGHIARAATEWTQRSRIEFPSQPPAYQY